MRRLLDRLIPPSTFVGLGRVEFVKATPPLTNRFMDDAAIKATGGICAPVGPAAYSFSYADLEADSMGWKLWIQKVRDMLPIFTASRGGISYRG